MILCGISAIRLEQGVKPPTLTVMTAKINVASPSFQGGLKQFIAPSHVNVFKLQGLVSFSKTSSVNKTTCYSDICWYNYLNNKGVGHQEALHCVAAVPAFIVFILIPVSV